MFEFFNLGDLVSGVPDVFRNVISGAKSLGDNVVGAFKSGAQSIGNLVTTLPDNIESAVKRVTNIADIVTKQSGKNISNLLSGPINSVGDLGKKTGEGLSSVFNSSIFTGPVVIGGLALAALIAIKL